MKIHLHVEQFDGHMHSNCGRSELKVVSQDEFEATESRLRCKFCEKYWFPNGQPDSHFKSCVEKFNEVKL